jgi:hypothetical protein
MNVSGLFVQGSDYISETNMEFFVFLILCGTIYCVERADILFRLDLTFWDMYFYEWVCVSFRNV